VPPMAQFASRALAIRKVSFPYTPVSTTMRRPHPLPGQIATARCGFSLIELVVVVMILGIIATIAAPKLLGTSAKASDSSLRHTLSVIRDAIDRYAADHDGKLPGADGQEATFKTDLDPYLRGDDFPDGVVGPAKNNAVEMMNGAGLAAAITAAEPTHSWLYNYATGEFYAACNDTAADQLTTYDKF
jgi:general secretion pathway protein G